MSPHWVNTFRRALLGLFCAAVLGSGRHCKPSRKRSTLVDETTVRKISMLTPNIGVAYSGMGPDSRLLVRRARKQAQVRRRIYKLPSV